MNLSHLFLAVALGATSAFAQLTVSPAAPKDRDPIYLELPAGYLSYQYYFIGTTMEAMKIKAWYQSVEAYFPTGPVTPASRIPLGQLPAGDYTVEVAIRNEGTRGSIPLRVAPRTASNAPLFNYTDLWWNPNESGWGLSIHQHASDVLFAAWFVYGDDGRPVWYVVPGGQWTTRADFSGPIYRTTGPTFTGTFDPNAVNRVPVGTAVFAFGGADLLSFGYTIDGWGGRKYLQRQTF